MNSGFRLVNFELDKKAVGRLLKSQEMLDLVKGEAEKRCDSESHVKSFIGFDRAHAMVFPDTERNPG